MGSESFQTDFILTNFPKHKGALTFFRQFTAFSASLQYCRGPYQSAFFLCSAAESNVKRVSLELGGKSPLIIFSDCDMEKAVRQVSYPSAICD